MYCKDLRVKRTRTGDTCERVYIFLYVQCTLCMYVRCKVIKNQMLAEMVAAHHDSKVEMELWTMYVWNGPHWRWENDAAFYIEKRTLQTSSLVCMRPSKQLYTSFFTLCVQCTHVL